MRFMSKYVYKKLKICGKTIFILGLDKNLQYDIPTLEMIGMYQTGIETYKGLRWEDYFITPYRSIFDKVILITQKRKGIKQHEGYRFAAILEFILGTYGDTLWDALKIMKKSDDIDNHYRKLKKVEETITIQDKKLSQVNKICALYYISPEIIKTGKGSIFLFSDIAKQRCDFKEKENIYRKYIIQKFSSINDVDKLANSSKTIGLNKSDIAKWSGIDEEDILEYKAVVAYKINVITPLAYDIVREAIEEISE